MENSSLLSKPYVKSSLSKFVIDRIVDSLIDGDIQVGERLPSETELSKGLGVGKSSVREAIKMLQALGVVEVRQGEGTFIRNKVLSDHTNFLLFQLVFEQSDFKDFMEVRKIFEMGSAELIINNADEEDLIKIKKALKEFHENLTPENDAAFHIAVLSATHNKYIIRFAKTIYRMFLGVTRRDQKTMDSKLLYYQHDETYDAIKKKDLDELIDSFNKIHMMWKEEQISEE
jgi:GntR family transcriptional repressor for pyruvate dehydrogenase complex